ncbi:putative phage-related endonuclease [Variovorax boronicumulans]|uniref:YqaJ viral recombinase family protein n=1 Tax=Variovorax boronicumulans TaxID=436515 RepID=UPI00278A47CF|nr:YqaJ viral recombinase family protein [Variovorax boronicumulans]MDP9992017.1 putative phage-related endonuclease [Variovorax boronicumulans]MDQ0001912.1 putative phage-related endonuclease [Variovorax boronicumulans]
MKQQHDLVQGTSEWDQFRLEHFGASEAAAMLGLSKKTTRNELLRMKKTGIAKTFSDWLQVNVLDHGHEVEAMARPHIEKLIGEELYPVTCSDGKESASCDGLSMDDRIAMEHKQWNETLAAIVAAGQVPDEHMPQCQQVLKVTGAEKLIFVVSDGTPDKMVYVWVFPSPEWFERLRAGWAQFEEDLAAYVPPEVVAEPVGRTPESLPALRIEVTGMVTASNLAQYREHALAVFAGINRDLKTDQDFANADKTVKWCGEVESRLAAAKQHALSQTESIDVLFKTIDDITAEARSTRLELDKLVKARKEARRGEIVAGGVKALTDHVAALNTRLGKPYMPSISADFGGAIKGLRTFDSMQNAVDTALSNAKIAASAAADRIQINLGTLRELAADHVFLFPDTAQIVQKAPEDLTSLVKTRIAEHDEKERVKAEEQRAKIAAEERAKAEAAVRAEQEAERQRIATEQVAQAAAAAAPAPVAAPAAALAPAAAAPVASPAPAPTVIAMPPRAQPAASVVPTLSIGAINEHLKVAGVSTTAEGLRVIGFEPAGRERAAPRYHETDLSHMLAAIVAHVQSIQAKQAA